LRHRVVVAGIAAPPRDEVSNVPILKAEARPRERGCERPGHAIDASASGIYRKRRMPVWRNW
jgi:hypothetical protein